MNMPPENSTFPLRFPQGLSRPISIVLYEPEIPLNVGSIARTCACIGSPLHLVGTLGFLPDNKIAKRAGLDYWELAEVYLHRSWEEFEQAVPGSSMKFLSTKGQKTFWDCQFRQNDFLVFGPETKGLPVELLASGRGEVLTIPMVVETRSLNLSNSVAIVAYEALRQILGRL
jgi:tRNA (cytidine/uridine-2'-O-)-methyltransferase